MNLCITPRKSVHVSDRLHLLSYCNSTNRNSRTLIHVLLSPPFHTKRVRKVCWRKKVPLCISLHPLNKNTSQKAASWRFFLKKKLLQLLFHISTWFGSLYLILYSVSCEHLHFNWGRDCLQHFVQLWIYENVFNWPLTKHLVHCVVIDRQNSNIYKLLISSICNFSDTDSSCCQSDCAEPSEQKPDRIEADPPRLRLMTRDTRYYNGGFGSWHRRVSLLAPVSSSLLIFQIPKRALTHSSQSGHSCHRTIKHKKYYQTEFSNRPTIILLMNYVCHVCARNNVY